MPASEASTLIKNNAPNLLSQESAALEAERQSIERELAELAQGKIKLELNGKLIEMELGTLELGNDLAKSQMMLEQKLTRALAQNPLGEKLIRSFMKEEQLRQALDLPDSGDGLVQLNANFNRKAARVGCGTLMATPALTLLGLLLFAVGLFTLFGTTPSPKPDIYPNPTLVITPTSASSSFPAYSTYPGSNTVGANDQLLPVGFYPLTPSLSSASPRSNSSATNSLSSTLATSSRQPTGLPPYQSAAGQSSAASPNPNPSQSDTTTNQPVRMMLKVASASSNRQTSSTTNNGSQSSIKANQTEEPGNGGGDNNNGTTHSQNNEGTGDSGEEPGRVGLPPNSAGGYNGPHGSFLPPSLLSVAALGLTGSPIVRGLTQEGQDEQGQPTLSLVWPRPFEITHFGAYPGELGNCVVLGTQSSLGLLRRLQLNDEIRLTDRKGNLFVYRVVSFSPAGQSERVVDLAGESWVFANTSEAVLTILVTLPQDVVPLSKNPATGQEQSALDDLTTTRRLAYRAVLSIYAPVPPTPFGTPVAVNQNVWQVPTATPITPTTTPTPTPTPTASPSLSPSSIAAGAAPVPTATTPIPTVTTVLPGLPQTGDGGCANGTCDNQLTPAPKRGR